jgi:hypothetical protein
VGYAAARAFRRGGLAVTTYLSLPSSAEPLLLLPVQMPGASAYALMNLTFPAGRVRRLRRQAVRTLLHSRVFPPVGPAVAVGHGADRRPVLVAAAAEFGVPRDVEFFVRGGVGDRLSRGVFFLFAGGSSTPSWVLKFARVEGYAAQFDADERGLAIAERIGAGSDGHAPRLLGRFEAAGRHASLETAAVGRSLGPLLRSVGLTGETRSAVERVAEWIAAKDIRSAVDSSELEAERVRLAKLARERTDVPFGAEVVAPLGRVPGVVLHDDLGCWNVVIQGPEFVVLDWESARAHGLPLWDLWYFVADAAATADRVPRECREEHLAALFRGEHELSPLLFRLTRRVVEALQIEADVVGTVATLCWLHHSQSRVTRARDLQRHGFDAEPAFHWPKPERWLADPALGLEWRRWLEGAA